MTANGRDGRLAHHGRGRVEGGGGRDEAEHHPVRRFTDFSCLECSQRTCALRQTDRPVCHCQVSADLCPKQRNSVSTLPSVGLYIKHKLSCWRRPRASAPPVRSPLSVRWSTHGVNTPEMPAERFVVGPARLVLPRSNSSSARSSPRGGQGASGRSVRRLGKPATHNARTPMPMAGKGPKTPTPPSLMKRRSSNLSREERGSIDSFDQSGSDRVLRSSSLSSVDDEIYTPDVTRRLFGGGQAREQWS